MRIAIASGKGGTGKTTVATNLAVTASRMGRRVGYLDCDVEEPNGALFLKPTVTETRSVDVSVPAVDTDLCTGCGKCGEICQYSAILAINGTVLTFPELCHGCSGCWLVCPSGAATESHHSTGQLDIGQAGEVLCVQGLLDVGQAMSPPIIAAVKAAAPDVDLLILDAPPGTSCPVIASVRGSDVVLLVTEPTPFGLHDLKLAVELIRAMGIPFGVVINRAEEDRGNPTHLYCQREGIEILAEIPDDRQVAETYSRGELACEAVPAYRRRFEALLNRLDEPVGRTSS